MQIRAFRPADEEGVTELWRACDLVRPWNDPHKDIQRKLGEQPELFLVGCIGKTLVATAMVGFDGHRGWVYYLAVEPGHQRLSIGRSMMAHAEALLLERGCPKITLMVRSGNESVIAFYEQLGYTQDTVVVLGKRLIPDL